MDKEGELIHSFRCEKGGISSSLLPTSDPTNIFFQGEKQILRWGLAPPTLPCPASRVQPSWCGNSGRGDCGTFTDTTCIWVILLRGKVLGSASGWLDGWVVCWLAGICLFVSFVPSIKSLYWATGKLTTSFIHTYLLPIFQNSVKIWSAFGTCFCFSFLEFCCFQSLLWHSQQPSGKEAK